MANGKGKMDEMTEEEKKKKKKKKKERKEKMMQRTIEEIINNYKNMETSLVNQLLIQTPAHPPTTGAYREGVWKSLFEQIIPHKFCIDQGVFIMDSYGKISAEVDLAIFDEQYTPYIFNYGKIKFIPIEAVAVVIQCKGEKLEEDVADEIKDWVESIRDLKTSLKSVARVMKGVIDNNPSKAKGENEDICKKTQTSTRPIRILCSTKKEDIDKNIVNLFDITLSITEEDGLKKTIHKKCEDYKCEYDYWYEELNHYGLDRFEKGEGYSKDIIIKSSLIDKNLDGLKVTRNGK